VKNDYGTESRLGPEWVGRTSGKKFQGRSFRLICLTSLKVINPHKPSSKMWVYIARKNEKESSECEYYSSNFAGSTPSKLLVEPFTLHKQPACACNALLCADICILIFIMHYPQIVIKSPMLCSLRDFYQQKMHKRVKSKVELTEEFGSLSYKRENNCKRMLGKHVFGYDFD
jgi:hypothetical protein